MSLSFLHEWEYVAEWIGQKVWGSVSHCWSCVEVLAKLPFSCRLRPPSYNGNIYLLHRPKVRSLAIAAGATARDGTWYNDYPTHMSDLKINTFTFTVSYRRVFKMSIVLLLTFKLICWQLARGSTPIVTAFEPKVAVCVCLATVYADRIECCSDWRTSPRSIRANFLQKVATSCTRCRLFLETQSGDVCVLF